MADNKKQATKKTGFVVVKFLNDEPGNKKGEKRTYHISTANTLVKKKIVEIVEELEEYVPKTAI